MTYIALIDHRDTQRKRFDASLHAMTLEGDEVVRSGTPHNPSHAALERMKARRARERR